MPLPVTAVVYQMFEALMAEGRGGLDHFVAADGHRGFGAAWAGSIALGEPIDARHEF